MKDVCELRTRHHDIALEKQNKVQADHMVYAWYEIDGEGRVDIAHFYDGVPKTDEEFDAVTAMKNSHIYAIHKHE